MRRLHRPDDTDKPFIARWNILARTLLVESSVKAVIRSAMDFADFDDGTSCHPSNRRIAREANLNERTVRFGWSVMRGLGMAVRVSRGVAHRGLADEYELRIPAGWETLPLLGPRCQPFTCLHCGKQFDPQGNCTVNAGRGDKPGDDTVRFNVSRMAFCPAPRRMRGRGGDSCLTTWNRRQAREGSPAFAKRGPEVWPLFRQARGDEW